MAKVQRLILKPYFYRRRANVALLVADTDHFLPKDILWSVQGTLYIVLDGAMGQRGERLVSVQGKYFKNEHAGGRLEALIPVHHVGGADIARYETQLKAALERGGA
jgi:hypothetical protein